MADDVLERYIAGHIEASTDDLVMFSWHGGEPLLAGLEFYKKAVALQRKYLPAGKTILNGIQTNGTLLNDELCRFMTDEGFIAGISIDGPEKIHNQYRVNRRNDPSFIQVMKGYELLLKYNIITEILCVTGAHNEKHPLDVYSFFRSAGARFISFLPLVNRDHVSGSGVTADSVNPSEFGNFLITVFDEWKEKDIGRIKVQLFEEALRTAFDQEHTLCVFKEVCGGVPVIESNGDFYSCDHFVSDSFRVGNIMNRRIDELLDSEEQFDFGRDKLLSLPNYCRKCPVRQMCNGECPKNRFVLTPDGESGLNYLCSGYKRFFTHCQPFIEAIKQARSAARPGPVV